MKIAHIASEMAPIAKVGGLGDVVYGLSKEQMRMGLSIEVILPNYQFIDRELLDRFKGSSARFEKIPLTLLGHYHEIYGGDEIERFSSFCALVMDYLESKAFDIVHLHDWPVSLLAPLIKKRFPKTTVILSIHNMRHQGLCKPEQLKNLDLPLSELKDPHQPDSVNCLLAGLLYSDAVVAVSPKYAKEVLSEPEGAGLENVLHQKQDQLSGVLNGIDTDYWDPKTDPFLVYHYELENPDIILVGKESNRAHLYHELNLDRTKAPLVCVITRLVPQKGLDLIEYALLKTLEFGGNFILLGSSPCHEIQARFNALAEKHRCPNLHCHFTFDERLAHMTYAASDMILIPSLFEPCGLTQMIAMRYGTVPIVRRTGGLADTVIDQANGFTFFDPTPAALEKTLSRAFHTYQNDPIIWKSLIEKGASGNYGWTRSAADYLSIYQKSIK